MGRKKRKDAGAKPPVKDGETTTTGPASGVTESWATGTAPPEDRLAAATEAPAAHPRSDGGGGGKAKSRRKRARLQRRRLEKERTKRAARRYERRGSGADADEGDDSDATPTAGADRRGGRKGRLTPGGEEDEGGDGREAGVNPPDGGLGGSGDCYFEVLRDGGAALRDGWVRSSWLNRSPWVVTCDCDGGFLREVEEKEDDAAARAAAGNNRTPRNGRRNLASDRDIDALHSRLCEIKRRLWPAATRCAEACNAMAPRDLVPADKENVAQGSMEEEADGADAGAEGTAMPTPTTPEAEFAEARRACNPLEQLGEGQHGGLNRLFVCRSAIKLANIDAMLGFPLTVKATEEEEGGGNNRPFMFVDLCGAPGGFSEYLLWRCHRRGVLNFRGYGMSLTGTNEHGTGAGWRLGHMAALDGGSAARFRVCGGADGTGDIYNWENVLALRDEIAADISENPLPLEAYHKGTTRNSGINALADLVVADGGFDAQRDAEDQEVLANKILVCQAAAALRLLRPGGTLVLKALGFRTEVTRRLIRILFRLFGWMAVVKPASSRPASAERYLICRHFHGVEPGWEGRAWRDVVLLGGALHDGVAETAGTEERGGNGTFEGFVSDRPLDVVDQHLNGVERAILHLNIKACLEIVSYLEKKVCEEGCQRFSKNTCMPLNCSVHVHTYNHAWDLG